jgi:hypothetical protein
MVARPNPTRTCTDYDVWNSYASGGGHRRVSGGGRLCGLAAGAFARDKRGEAMIEFVDIKLRIEVAAAPFEQFRVALVL